MLCSIKEKCTNQLGTNLSTSSLIISLKISIFYRKSFSTLKLVQEIIWNLSSKQLPLYQKSVQSKLMWLKNTWKLSRNILSSINPCWQKKATWKLKNKWKVFSNCFKTNLTHLSISSNQLFIKQIIKTFWNIRNNQIC